MSIADDGVPPADEHAAVMRIETAGAFRNRACPLEIEHVRVDLVRADGVLPVKGYRHGAQPRGAVHHKVHALLKRRFRIVSRRAGRARYREQRRQ